MPSGLHHSPGRLAALLVALVAILVAACGGSGDPSCHGDRRSAGMFADLERALPTELRGHVPTTVDSGENCTRAALGTLAGRIRSLRFAGATWDFGHGTAVTVAYLANPDGQLPATDVEAFYEAGARSAPKTGNIEITRPDLAGIGHAYRIDALNDLSLQTVVVWPSASGGVNVILVATAISPTAVRADHDALVLDTVATAAAAP